MGGRERGREEKPSLQCKLGSISLLVSAFKNDKEHERRKRKADAKRLLWRTVLYAGELKMQVLISTRFVGGEKQGQPDRTGARAL
jgi:hypothetical protein